MAGSTRRTTRTAKDSESAPPPPAPTSPPPSGPRKLFKIGEVMQYTGLTRQTVHNYTMLGLIHAGEKTLSGHRLYDEGVFKIVEWIKMLKAHHPLIEIKQIMAQKFPDYYAPKA
ncbi:MAG: MerR family transcriptional [Planctomycetota bacterium]|nr:MAG: MerR family transcriptional [Planctomycetota bacterium]